MEPTKLNPNISMRNTRVETTDSLQPRLVLCVFLMILEGKVKGLVQMLRAWSIAWDGGNSPSENAQPWK